jgi:hypothetical protein
MPPASTFSHRRKLDGHRIRVHGLLARHSFETEQDTAIVVLVTLHDEAALLVAVGPGDADEAFFDLHKSCSLARLLLLVERQELLIDLPALKQSSKTMIPIEEFSKAS